MSKKTAKKNKSFRVVQYNKRSLLNVLHYGSYSKKDISYSYLYHYLCNFLKYKRKYGHNVKTMIIEEKYLSESYFKDYKNYFAESFHDYSKFTRRVHFFTEKIRDDKHFERVILCQNGAHTLEDIDILESYIGYTVIKPISSAFLGATFLKPYPPTLKNVNTHRNYNSVVDQKINLFGKRLEIEGCAFQEQDRVVSACATAALWSALYITNRIFSSLILSPSDITKSAGLSSSGNRSFPNNSLQNRQISKALKKAGLVCEIRFNTDDAAIVENQNLKRIIYAYNKIKIPILLGYSYDKEVSLNEKEMPKQDSKLKSIEDKEEKETQHHLVTVLGYKIGDDSKVAELSLKPNSDGLKLKADKIYKLYSHNDQIGPYVRIKLGDNETNEIKAWEIGNIYQEANVISMLIPLIDTIRVKFEDVISSVQEISDIVNDAMFILNEERFLENNGFQWDVHLIKSNDYKEEILNDESIDEQIKSKIAFTSYPKYLWLAKCTMIEYSGKESKLLDVLYDPSDAPTGFCCFQANFFKPIFAYEFIESMKATFEKSANIENDYGGLQILNENHKKFFMDAYRNNEDQFLSNLKEF